MDEYHEPGVIVTISTHVENHAHEEFDCKEVVVSCILMLKCGHGMKCGHDFRSFTWYTHV